MIPSLQKYPEENRTITFDFREALFTSDTLTGTPTVTGSAGITLSAPTLDVANASVYVHCSGGTLNSDYTVRCEVDTLAGDHLKATVRVEVRDDVN